MEKTKRRGRPSNEAKQQQAQEARLAHHQERMAKHYELMGRWLDSNKPALMLCQQVLVRAYWEAVESSENDWTILSEIDDAIDLLGQTVADLREHCDMGKFWPENQASK